MREGCAWVAERSENVLIARDPVEYCLELLAEPEGLEVEWDRATHYAGGEEETAAYVITLDAINFGSGYFPHLLKRSGSSGYFTIALGLKESFERRGPFSATELQRLDPSSVSRLFEQEPGDPVRDELMTHFTRALNDLGAFLAEKFGGSFARFVGSAAGSAEQMVENLLAMPYFRDFASYRGRQIPLLKRAQITPSDLALAPCGAMSEFFDLDRLTIFADNLVPHVLRLDGVLQYSPALSARLEQGELLPPGSAVEVEIRATALHVVETMVSGLRDQGPPLEARHLDLLLWNRGQAERYRGGSKHRTRTVFY